MLLLDLVPAQFQELTIQMILRQEYQKELMIPLEQKHLQVVKLMDIFVVVMTLLHSTALL